jgi:hypothetical protein
MSNKVLLKKSSVASKIPLTSDLDYGELALNYTDGKLYYKTASNTIDVHASISATATLTNKTLTSPIITLLDSQFTLQDDVDPTKQAQFQLSGITTGTTGTYTLPAATTTLAGLGTTQTFTGTTNTFSGTLTVSGAMSITSATFTRTATTQAWLDGSMTTAAWTVGGTAQTGAITLGRSTAAQTVNIATGATAISTTKAVNIGTSGVSGSISNITIGSATAGTDTTLNVTGRLAVVQPTGGIGTVTNTASGTTVTGVDTLFTRTFQVGDSITIGGQTVAISAIASDTSMTTAAITNANATATAYTLTGGTRFVVNGNGNVAIGGNTPASNPKLALYGGMRFLSNETAAATYTGIGSIASDTVSISTSGSERMRIFASGGVSIGNTTDPGVTNLSVTGSITARYTTKSTVTTSATSVTPDVSVYNQYSYTALAAGLTINAPIGTPLDGDKLTLRIEDNGITAQTLSWNAIYRVIGTVLPTLTVLGKLLYVGCIYNAADTKWDVTAVAREA